MKVFITSATPNARRVLALITVTTIMVALTACSPRGCEPTRIKVIGDLVINHAQPLEWRELDPGLAFTRLEFTRNSTGKRVMIAALRIDPERYRFALLDAPEQVAKPAAWINGMSARTKAIVAVNASFYLPATYEPIGLVVADGKVKNQWKAGAGSGLFRVRDGQALIEWAKTYKTEWVDDELAVQANPLVIEPGGKEGIYKNAIKYRSRTAVGLDHDHMAIMLCTLRNDDEGLELSGIDLYELMQIMQLEAEHGGLELIAALNLDGGTSTAMNVNHPRLKLKIRSTHPVANGIGVFKR